MTTARAANPSASRRILHAASWVTAAAVLVKLTATGKEFLVASIFARSADVDAFLVALLIPNLLVNLFAESMNQALVPALIRLRAQHGEDAASRVLSSAMLLSLSLLAALAAVLALAAPVFFPPLFHFSPPQLALAIRLFRALLLFALFGALASNGTAILNALECFAAPAIAPILVPLAIILALLALPRSVGIWSLVIGNLVGAFLWVVAIFLLVLRSGHRFTPPSLTPELSQLFGQYAGILLSGVVSSGGLLADVICASWLAIGSVAALNWASRFSSVTMTILGGAIGTAITPYLAQRVAARDWPGCRRILRRYTALAALVTLPLTAVFMTASRPIIALAYQHGAFHAADTLLVARIQSVFALQIPFFVVSRVFYRFLLVLERSSLVLACGAINLVLDIVFNLVLMRIYGVVGIALATSFWTVCTFLFLAWWARRLLRGAAASGAAA